MTTKIEAVTELLEKYAPVRARVELNSEPSIGLTLLEPFFEDIVVETLGFEVCPGFKQYDERSFRNAELNLFGPGVDTVCLLITFEDWAMSKKGSYVLCNLDHDTVRSQLHISAYINLAELHPEITFLLETSESQLFEDIYPQGVSFPENIFLGTSVTNPEEWKSPKVIMDKACTINKYVRLINPQGQFDLEKLPGGGKTGSDISWIIGVIDSQATDAEASVEALSSLLAQAGQECVPMIVEGAVCDQDCEEEVFYANGPIGKQFPLDYSLRMEERGQPPLGPLHLTFQEELFRDKVQPNISRMFQICRHVANVTQEELSEQK